LAQIRNRKELQNCATTTGLEDAVCCSDAALLLSCYATRGARGLRVVNGHFAGAVIDIASRSVSLVLDRVGGLYTVYYAAASESLLFSTNIHAILSAGVISTELDRPSLQRYLADGYVLPPATMLTKVRKVAPGECVTLKPGHHASVEVFDCIDATGSVSARTDSRDLPEVIRDAMVRSLIDQENTPAFLLSGGIDSSVAVAVGSTLCQEPLSTFTGAFPGTALDESAYAIEVAQHCGAHNRVVDLGNRRALDALPSIIWHLGEPTLDYSIIPTHQLLGEVARSSGFVVSGDGPDHLFGRYYPLAVKRYLAKGLAWPCVSAVERWAPSRSARAAVRKIHRAGAGHIYGAYVSSRP